MPQFQMGVVDACAVLGPFALLGIWVGAIFGMGAVFTALRRLTPTQRRVVTAVAMIAAVVFGGADVAFAAIPMPAHCVYMNENQWPCPIIEALWCPCYWNSPPPPDGF